MCLWGVALCHAPFLSSADIQESLEGWWRRGEVGVPGGGRGAGGDAGGIAVEVL